MIYTRFPRLMATNIDIVTVSLIPYYPLPAATLVIYPIHFLLRTKGHIH